MSHSFSIPYSQVELEKPVLPQLLGLADFTFARAKKTLSALAGKEWGWVGGWGGREFAFIAFKGLQITAQSSVQSSSLSILTTILFKV